MNEHWDFRWMMWQVGLPLIGPIFVSSLAAGMWWASGSGFDPKFRVILDISPWALAIYSLTLLCTSVRDLGDRIGNNVSLVIGAVGIGAAQLLLYAFLVIKRHLSGYQPPASAYVVSLFLLSLSLIVCYRMRLRPTLETP